MINNIRTIGIVGGGQLGKMMILEAKRLGFRIATLDPGAACPAHSISDVHIEAGFEDKEGYLKLAEISDVITYEFEHINVAMLEQLEQKGHTVLPSVTSLKIIQDKLWQKQALLKHGIPVPKFTEANTLQDLQDYYAAAKKPFFLKSRKGGYDGKGNYLVRGADDIEAGFNRLGGKELMIEELINFDKEVSVIATRAASGECVIYPIAENIHKSSILDTTTVPAAVSAKEKAQIMDIAAKVMECFGGVGTFCAELFVGKDGVMVNEVAPRVHNTGHYTIEACRVSQFENHIRAITGLGLGSTDMTVGAAIMKNIIGGTGQDGAAKFTGIEAAYKFPSASAHVYGKGEVKEGRKMGHVTVTGGSVKEVKTILSKINIECKAENKYKI